MLSGVILRNFKNLEKCILKSKIIQIHPYGLIFCRIKTTTSSDLPHLKKLNISKLLIAGMPAIAKIEIESDKMFEKINSNSKFIWYHSKETFENEEGKVLDEANRSNEQKAAKKHKPQLDFDNMEWVLMKEGINSKMCTLSEDCENRYVKVVCIPSDGEREGKAIECRSNYLVQKKIDLQMLPMTERHKLTTQKLDSDK